MRKKTIYSGIILLMLLLPFAAGASRLSVEAGNLERGKTNTLRLVLDNADQEFYGFQADVWLPYGVEPARGDNGELAISLSDRADKGGYTLSANVLSNGEVRMGTYSTNKTPFSGDSGVLVNMTVYVAPDFYGGDVTIGNILMVDSESNDIQLDSYSEYVSPIVEVTSVWFDQTEMTMTEGEERRLHVNIDPWDATDQAINWWTSDESIANVNANGTEATVTALAPGYVEIHAQSSNGMTATCRITVEARIIEIESIVLDVESLELEVGDTHQLVATVYPSDATDKELKWWVDDENVATVDHSGFVKMIGEGSTKVHVRSVRWNHVEATCHLDVSADVQGLIADGSPCDVYTADGHLLRKSVSSSQLVDLPKGLYLIRQHGTTIKLLK